MNSCIYIDGLALWAVLIFIFLWFIVTCVIANDWIKLKKDTHKKDRVIKNLRDTNERLLNLCHKKTFKLPEVNDVL